MMPVCNPVHLASEISVYCNQKMDTPTKLLNFVMEKLNNRFCWHSSASIKEEYELYLYNYNLVKLSLSNAELI